MHRIEWMHYANSREAWPTTSTTSSVRSAVMHSCCKSTSQTKKSEADHLERILEASLRAKGIIAQILSCSRDNTEDGKPLHLSTLLREIWPILTATLPSNVILQEFVSPDSERDAYVHGDAAGIHQILLNLTSNVVHAVDKESGNVSVSLDVSSVSEAKRTVTFSIEDNGKGMSARTQERIFQPYFTTKAMGRGTGLGLSVVYGIVQDLGGEISVESQEGKGSRFTVTLPCLACEAIDTLAGPDCSSEPLERDDGLDRGTGDILVIDDEPALMELMELMLNGAGYPVVGFANPEEALETFRQEPWRFRGIISDNAMPGMTGLTLSEKLLEIRPDVPIVLCSGNQEVTNGSATDPEEIVFFQNPVNWDDLLATVADFPSVSRQEQREV